jgi:hypothetical protein
LKKVKEPETQMIKTPTNIKKTTIVSMDKTNQSEVEGISNDLFDWLMWIDHTLESQVVTVGDNDEIQQAIDKLNVIISF